MPRNPDRTDLCHFTYSDGRRCTLPQFPDDMGLCYHHGQKRRAFLESRQAGRETSRFLRNDIHTACDLSATLAALFAATAEGYIKPKAAATLAYISQLMLQTQKLAKQEFLEAFEATWPDVVAAAPAFHDPEFWDEQIQSGPQSQPQSDSQSTPLLVPDSPPPDNPTSASHDPASADASPVSTDPQVDTPAPRVVSIANPL